MADITNKLDSIRKISLRYYRINHWVGRAAAGYSALIGGLPEKFLLVELVSLLMRHAQRLAERLWELGVDNATVAGYPAGWHDHIAARSADGDWLPPLRDLATLVGELGSAYERIAEDLPAVPERRPDRELYEDMARDIRHVVGQPDIAETLSRLDRSDELLTVLASSSAIVEKPLPTPEVRERVYGPDMKTTREPVRPSFKPVTQEEIAFFVHNQLQIEFVAIDTAMRNISDFDGLPLSFYVDQARHAHDEVRHTQMLLIELARLGAGINDFPLEIPDRFAIIIDLPLAHRLVVLSRTGESEAIEAVQVVIPHLLEQGAVAVATMMENVLYDEVRHTWYGNKWLRWLCGDDDRKVAEETAAALVRYNAAVDALGMRMNHREPDYLESVGRRGRWLDAELRMHAGFTEPEVALMRGLRHWSW